MNNVHTEHGPQATTATPPTGNDVVISVNHVSKKFCRNLKRSMAYGIADLARNLLSINPDTGKLRQGEFWALDEVSFELKRGEVLGVVGANGSGKSTLLRLLAGIFPPDKGEIMINGRVSPLIAVGAGFHPHMTGRENIFLNGTILGMSKEEIQERYDEIVEFADIGDFLDAPVSTYSSGMRVRLGFAIAVHSNPGILLADEVLAVGDYAFRLKCYDKIMQLLNRSTVILVSHSELAIRTVCQKVAIFDKGRILDIGSTDEMLLAYKSLQTRKRLDTEHDQVKESPFTEKSYSLDVVKITRVELRDTHHEIIRINHKEQKKIPYSKQNTLICSVEFEVTEDIPTPLFWCYIKDPFVEGTVNVCGAAASVEDPPAVEGLTKGEKRVTYVLDISRLTPNTYAIHFGVSDSQLKNKYYGYIDSTDKITFEVIHSAEFHQETAFLATPYYLSDYTFTIEER